MDGRAPEVNWSGAARDVTSGSGLPFSAIALLTAIEGIAYAADEAGIILGFSRGPFMPPKNHLPGVPWDYQQAVGTCLFDQVQGAEVRDSYRALHRAVWSGSRLAIGFEYRCDSRRSNAKCVCRCR